MLQRINWRVAFGVFFIGLGLVTLLIGDWQDAAWGIVFGMGSLGIAYGQKHPEQSRGVLAWVLVIAWIISFGWLTILRFQR